MQDKSKRLAKIKRHCSKNNWINLNVKVKRSPNVNKTFPQRFDDANLLPVYKVHGRYVGLFVCLFGWFDVLRPSLQLWSSPHSPTTLK